MKYLIIPGLYGSNEMHWQSRWETLLPCIRVHQKNWDQPQLEEWLNQLNQTIEACEEDIVFIAHSLGCILVLHWAKRYQNTKVMAALLVAPADVDDPKRTPEIVRHFAPIPLLKLPFNSLVVSSENDPYMDVNRSIYFANTWCARFVNAGRIGHINAQSNLGDWEYGLKLLESLNPI